MNAESALVCVVGDATPRLRGLRLIAKSIAGRALLPLFLYVYTRGAVAARQSSPREKAEEENDRASDPTSRSHLTRTRRPECKCKYIIYATPLLFFSLYLFCSPRERDKNQRVSGAAKARRVFFFRPGVSWWGFFGVGWSRGNDENWNEIDWGLHYRVTKVRGRRMRSPLQ